MTRDEINRAISESIEPMPDGPPADIEITRLSPLGAWKYGVERSWRHRNWDTHESANAMLLDRMRNPQLSRDKDGVWSIVTDQYAFLPAPGFAQNRDRKLVVHAAYCAWKGIEDK